MGPNTNVVIRARDPEKLAAAKTAVNDMLVKMRAHYAQIEKAGDFARPAN